MWSDLKTILNGSDKCIIVEEGEPRYVVLSFKEYQHLQGRGSDSIVRETADSGEGANRELSEAADEDFFDEDDISYESERRDRPAINIQDLPF